jgi:crossover junction endodeoxyribonuclease RuvC
VTRPNTDPLLFLGVDPGLSGAIAGIATNGRVFVYEMPTIAVEVNGKQRREINGYLLDTIIRNITVLPYRVVITVEKVWAMAKPGDAVQGVTSMFNFGVAFGRLRQCLECNGLAYRMVAPVTWKSKVLCEYRKGTKQDSVNWIQAKMPAVFDLLTPPGKRKPQDGIADAICIGQYGRMLSENA